MSKYHINKEFLPYLCFAPPIKNAKPGGRIGSMMKPPRWIWHDSEVSVTKNTSKVTTAYECLKINATELLRSRWEVTNHWLL